MMATYYDEMSQILSDPQWCGWDYYGCNGAQSVQSLFAKPRRFIQNTFLCAQKSMLTSSLVDGEYQIKEISLSEARAAHSISAFFLGYVLLGGLCPRCITNFCGTTEEQIFPFSYVWTLVSLYHDYGYQYETNPLYMDELLKTKSKKRLFRIRSTHNENMLGVVKQKEQIEHSVWDFKNRERHIYPNKGGKSLSLSEREVIENYLETRMPSFRCADMFTYPMPRLSYSRINQYFNYRLMGMEDWSCVDHGIMGGLLFYDLIIKNYLWEYSREKERNPNTCIYSFIISNILDRTLSVNLEQTAMFLYVADCIMNHNIWKASPDKEDIYREYGLDFLIGDKFRKISFRNNPLLFLLCFVDTLEPYKNFHKCTFGRGIDEMEYNWENVENIYRRVEIEVKEGIVIMNIPAEWKEVFVQHLDGMKDWMEIEYSYSEGSFAISVL